MTGSSEEFIQEKISKKTKYEVVMAIDFGNSNIRVALSYKNQYYVLKNVYNLYRFPQIVVLVNDQYNEIGTEAETNLVGNCKSYYKDFKYNILSGKKTNIDNFFIITEILKHYFQMGKEFAWENFEEKVINRVILTVPLLDKYKEKWIPILRKCAIEAGLKNIETRNEEEATVCYYIKTFNTQKMFCVFNLGSIYFYSSIWKYNNVTNLEATSYEIDGGISFDSKLQNLFDRKIKEYISVNILKPLIKIEKYNFDELFNEKFLTENKKYLAECFIKYRQVLENFSGNSKSMSLEFRHVIDEQEIEITITKNELLKEFENLMNDLKQLINDTKTWFNGIPFHLIIFGNGSRIPGVKDLFKSEFKEAFHQRGVFYDEEVVKGALIMRKNII
jgi:molecular chaperone DnaK (HSP70)